MTEIGGYDTRSQIDADKLLFSKDSANGVAETVKAVHVDEKMKQVVMAESAASTGRKE